MPDPQRADPPAQVKNPGPRREVTITDPHHLRALAHPARQRVLAELYAGEVLTASEAARLCDTSPSAMSYHLRALHRVGLIEPVVSGDGRERPWRKAADSFDVDRSAYVTAGPAATQEQLNVWSGEIVTGLETLARNLSTGHSGGLVTSGRIWVTDDEEQQLGRDILDLWKRYQGRTRRKHPADASVRVLYLLSVPSET